MCSLDNAAGPVRQEEGVSEQTKPDRPYAQSDRRWPGASPHTWYEPLHVISEMVVGPPVRRNNQEIVIPLSTGLDVPSDHP